MRYKSLLALTLQLSVLAIGAGEEAIAQAPVTIRDVGPSDRRLDIMIASEGYDQDDLTVVGPDGLTEFRRDLEMFIGDLFSFEPLAEYAEYVNIHRLEVASVDSGIGAGKDTKFNVGLNNSGCPTLANNEEQALTTLRSLVGPSFMFTADLIVLLVNTDADCSSGGVPTLVSAKGGWLFPSKHFAHEVFGHQLANLADEIFFPGEQHSRCSNLNMPLPGRPNVQRWPSNPGAPNELRWGHWIDDPSVLAGILAGNPTVHSGGNPVLPVGLYEGAWECPIFPNIFYRATHRSLMWSTDEGGEFGSVNAEVIVRSIYGDTNPIDASYPASNAETVRIGNRRSVSFEVVPMAKPTNPLSTRFVVSLGFDAPVAVVDVVGPASAAGGHRVAIGGLYHAVGVVEDHTPLVKHDPNEELMEYRVWPFEVVCTSDCNDSGNVVINELITAVNRAMNRPGVCDHADGNNDGRVTISELLDGVQNMLRGCTTAIVPPTPGGTTSGMIGPPEIQIGTVGGIAGQVVSVPISVSGGNVLAGLQLDVTFEDTDISLANADTPCTLDPSADDMELDTSIATVAPGQTRLRVLVIDTTAPISTFSDGVVMKCNFRIDATAPSPSSVQLIGSLNEVVDESLEVLDSSVTNGSVNICPGCGCS